MGVATGCDDFLDVTPPSELTDADYFHLADHLAAYTRNLFADYDSLYSNSVSIW